MSLRSRTFLLFDLDDASTTTLDPSHYHRHLTQTNPVAELSLFADAISQPYFLNHSTRFSLLTPYGVRGMIIPTRMAPLEVQSSTSVFSPELILDTQYACIGYDHALICCWPKLITLQYAWPDDSPCTLVAENLFHQTTCEDPDDSRWPDVLFDKSSGRIVLSVTREQNTFY
jgi:hypothetical protein